MKSILLALVFLSFSSFALAQEKPISQTIDPSKPTNLYTQVNVQGELNSYRGFDTYGTRLNFQYAFNENNLVLAEVPFLYHSKTQHFGISDTRVRYFNVQRLKSKTLFALAPFLDVYIPAGKAEHGLGAGTWSLSAGVIAGLIFSKSVSMYPGAGYVYLTQSQSSGLQLQSNLSLKFSESTFAFINPSVLIMDSQTIWQGEIDINQIFIQNKFKGNIGWLPNFTNKVNTFRIGVTFFM